MRRGGREQKGGSTEKACEGMGAGSRETGERLSIREEMAEESEQRGKEAEGVGRLGKEERGEEGGDPLFVVLRGPRGTQSCTTQTR